MDDRLHPQQDRQSPGTRQRRARASWPWRTFPPATTPSCGSMIGETADGGVNIRGQAHPFANYVIDDSNDYHELKIPSGFQTGVKIVQGFEINENRTTELLLDFDASRSGRRRRPQRQVPPQADDPGARDRARRDRRRPHVHPGRRPEPGRHPRGPRQRPSLRRHGRRRQGPGRRPDRHSQRRRRGLQALHRGGRLRLSPAGWETWSPSTRRSPSSSPSKPTRRPPRISRSRTSPRPISAPWRAGFRSPARPPTPT
ncbi:MAG: DUF4382 domain-containing protein [Comamonadaceae bacterium]|nr:DUF4382 domain-containing protein [Comamonadaceae bacterium]